QKVLSCQGNNLLETGLHMPNLGSCCFCITRVNLGVTFMHKGIPVIHIRLFCYSPRHRETSDRSERTMILWETYSGCSARRLDGYVLSFSNSWCTRCLVP